MVFKNGNIRSIKSPVLLGWAGTIPFLIFSLSIIFGSDFSVFARDAGIIYSALILTFLGAVHWGWMLKEDLKKFDKLIIWIWGITPSLIAWISLMILIVFNNYKVSSVFIVFGFLCALIIDYKIFYSIKWFVKLRAGLSLVAISSTLINGFF